MHIPPQLASEHDVLEAVRIGVTVPRNHEVNHSREFLWFVHGHVASSGPRCQEAINKVFSALLNAGGIPRVTFGKIPCLLDSASRVVGRLVAEGAVTGASIEFGFEERQVADRVQQRPIACLLIVAEFTPLPVTAGPVGERRLRVDVFDLQPLRTGRVLETTQDIAGERKRGMGQGQPNRRVLGVLRSIAPGSFFGSALKSLHKVPDSPMSRARPTSVRRMKSD